MRSPADAARRWVERLLRTAALVLLAWLIWQALLPAAPGRRVVHLAGAELPGRIAEVSRNAPDSLVVSFRAAPGDTLAAWLGALGRSGVGVAWTDAGVPPLAAELYPTGDPDGSATLLVAAPAGMRAAVADALGPLDTLASGALGGALRLPAPSGTLRVQVGEQSLNVAPRDSLAPGAVLVLGRAGWEAKFIAAALEEAGWRTATRLEVAPGLVVRQGDAGSFDPRRFAAVIATDESTVEQARSLGEYVAAGGGLVLLGAAAAAPEFGALTPAAGRAGAVPLERREGEPAGWAARVGAGRVIRIADAETWPWRMEGGEGEHRAWWSALVASAARRDATPLARFPDDPAPRAALFDALGAPSAASAEAPAPSAPHWPREVVFAALVALLLVEWASRRTRGAR
jgi:hypothetical protein